jgi:hypothetical protein
MAGRVDGYGSRVTLVVAVALLLGLLAAPARASVSGETSTCGTTAAITLDPVEGEAGTLVTLSGTGFCPDTKATVWFQDAAGTRTALARKAVNPDGTLSLGVTIPGNAAPGYGSMRALDLAARQCPWASFEVTSPG